jgi:hypothetical protein
MIHNAAQSYMWNGSSWERAHTGGFIEQAFNTGFTPPEVWWSESVATGSTAHTKGSWVTLEDPVPIDVNIVVLSIGTGIGNVNTSTLIDIGVGAAGSETVIASNIAVGGKTTLAVGGSIIIPLSISAGQRIAVRSQGIIASSSSQVIMELYYVNFPVSNHVDVYGTDTSTSTGTALSTASWTEITPSTTQDYQYLGLVVSISTNNIPTNLNVNLEIATGAPGSENVIKSALFFVTVNESVNKAPTANAMNWEEIFTTPTGIIPAGTRISAKINQSQLWLTIIGVPFP